MPLIPNLLERLALRLNLAPGFLFDLLPAGVFRGLAAAVRLGVLEALRDGPRTAEEVARQLGTDERATGILLEALAAFGHVRQVAGGYRNTPSTTKWLLQDAPTSFAAYPPLWHEAIFPFWDRRIDVVIRDGRPPETLYEWLDRQPGGWDVTQGGFEALARWVAPRVAAKLKLPPGARRLLDVGGGHGLYAIEFCRRHPELSATVFDRPLALRPAQARVAEARLDDRVSLQEGDYLVDDLGSGYDVALLFNVVHAHRPEENLKLLRKAAAALKPASSLFIFDQFHDRALGRLERASTRFFALNYLVTLGGQTYSFAEVSNWLTASGFVGPRLRRIGGFRFVSAARES